MEKCNYNNYYRPYYQGWRGYESYGRANVYNKWNRGVNYNKFKTKQTCEICKEDHKIWQCYHCQHGQEMREVLKKLDRCDACLQKKQHHPNGWYNISWGKRPKCSYCGQVNHESITCDGGEHPGSWIINVRNENEYEEASSGKNILEMEMHFLSSNAVYKCQWIWQ